MDLGLMFFSSLDRKEGHKYRLLCDAARFADEHGLCSIWIPERHFHPFGGLFPNPAVVSAALAVQTQRLQIRAGSLISPLHNPIRVAEDWSIVDNLSGGRVAVSFGSGWNVNDFIFFPERYEQRKTIMWEQIKTIQRLWRGGSVLQKNSYGKDVKVTIYPQPLQRDLPIWITSGGNVGTFMNAGMIGAHVLTHMSKQPLDALAGHIRRYRESLVLNGFEPQQGKVAVMLHTFIDADAATARTRATAPLREYLRSSTNLENMAGRGGGIISTGTTFTPEELASDIVDDLLESTVSWYLQHGSLIGSVESCLEMAHKLAEVGVSEIACLIDFVDSYDTVMKSLSYVAELQSALHRVTAETARHDNGHTE